MQTQKVIVSILFLCVPLLLLFTFTYLPFFKMVQFSFYDMKYIGKRTWVGLQNYISVFTREDCLNALKLSLFYLVGSFVQIAIALLFASILSFPTKGGKFFRGALYFPSLIGGIAVGFIFKFFFTHGFVLDTLLTWVGMDADSLPFWLKDKSINNWVLAATSIWRYMGQNMVLFIGAIASVDTTQYEAAAIDGCPPMRTFWKIMFPMAQSGIVTVTIFNFINIWNEYFLSLIFASSDKLKPVAPGLYGMINSMKYTGDWAGMFAAVIIVFLPTFILYIFLSEKIIGGVTGGIKG